MATVAMQLVAERWLDEVLLIGQSLDINGVMADEYTLPAGLGDVAIMHVHVRILTIDVLVVPTVPIGVSAYVTSGDGSGGVLDSVGSGQFFANNNTANALGLTAFIDPDALCLWQQNERLQLIYGEIDTDATPTADAQVRVKAVRVRPLASAGLPLQLVR